MAQQQRAHLLQKEGRLSLASITFSRNPSQSLRALAHSFDVPESTLRTRLKGTQARHEIRSTNRKLSLYEEQSLVERVLSLNRRGFPPYIIDIGRMANSLLAARGQRPPPRLVGKCWTSRFINAQPEIQTKWNRKFHAQRAKCEDPVKYGAWYKLVRETREEYGILEEDTYNFDETGFMMGVASTSKVVTSSDTVGRAIAIQPGNREWVTVIETINAAGWALPPFVILAGKLHQAAWYKSLPADWVIALSHNGWTTDELGYEWVQHFNRHTEARTQGAYRLLILDGHSSHATPEFDLYCIEHKIITLCMPAHTSHRLQPLDVACYSPLKLKYGNEVTELARQGIYHIDKIEFLDIYTRVRPAVFSSQNARSGFLATGLIPFDPERVLSLLPVVRTPSPPPVSAGSAPAWTSETPHTTAQLEQQARLVNSLLQRGSQSPTSQAVNQLVKGCQLAINSAVLLATENKKLHQANQRKKKKQAQRRRYIAQGGVLTGQEGQRLAQIAENAEEVVVQSEATEARLRAPPTCSNCHIQGHNRRQCRVGREAAS